MLQHDPEVLIQRFTHSLTHSFARSLTHSLIHSLSHSLTHSLAHSLTLRAHGRVPTCPWLEARRCWIPNLGPVEQQPVFLTAELCLRPLGILCATGFHTDHLIVHSMWAEFQDLVIHSSCMDLCPSKMAARPFALSCPISPQAVQLPPSGITVGWAPTSSWGLLSKCTFLCATL